MLIKFNEFSNNPNKTIDPIFQNNEEFSDIADELADVWLNDLGRFADLEETYNGGYISTNKIKRLIEQDIAEGAADAKALIKKYRITAKNYDEATGKIPATEPLDSSWTQSFVQHQLGISIHY